MTTSPDPTHLVIDGRRWRASQPTIPEPLRQSLVNELMSARRAVGSGSRESDDDAVTAARARVQDAKVALGERGPEWWTELDDPELAPRVESALRSLLRSRDADATTCPSDIARIVGGSTWRTRMQLVRDIAAGLHDARELEIRQRGTRVDDPRVLRGPIRIGRGPNFT